jgi:hypothetical protein
MNRPTDSFKGFAPWLLAFVLAVVGAHCWLVWLYGSPLPFWDQWDEALSLFKPWKDGHLTWADIAAPASDHRIILTHFLDMALVSLNGRWDPMLQMTVNVFIHAGYAALLAFSLWHYGGRKQAWLVCLLLLPFFTLPFAGENAVWGMNSLWYLISLLGLGAIVGLGFFPPGSWPWWLGLAAALLGLLSMALGPVATIAVGGLLVLRSLRERRLVRANLVSFAVCLAVVGLGALFIVRAEGFRPLQAHSFAEFTAALVRQLDWPFFRVPEMACLILLPLALLLVYYLRPGFQNPRGAELLLTLALWSVLDSAMLAFGRANYGEVIPASRYTEVFALLLITSLFALLLLGEQWRHDRVLNWNPVLLPIFFAGVIVWGLARMSDIVVDNLLVPTRAMNLIAEERLAAFALSGHDQDLAAPPGIRPNPEHTLWVLRDPKLQPILPPGCLPAAAAPAPGWLTTASQDLLRCGQAMLIAGLALFAGLCAFGLARGTMGLSLREPGGIVALLAGLAAFGLVCSKHALGRESVEFALQQQLAADFQAVGNAPRAAFHAHKAEALKSFK